MIFVEKLEKILIYLLVEQSTSSGAMFVQFSLRDKSDYLPCYHSIPHVSIFFIIQFCLRTIIFQITLTLLLAQLALPVFFAECS